MKVRALGLLGILSVFVAATAQVSLASPESFSQIVLQEHQKRVITEKLADQADKYSGQGAYFRQGSWSLDRVKTDLKASLAKTEKWVKTHLTFHFHANKAKAATAAEKAQLEADFQRNTQNAQTYFETRKEAVDRYNSVQQVIEAHEQAIQDVAKSENYLFVITDHAVAFDGTFIDSMVLVLTATVD